MLATICSVLLLAQLQDVVLTLLLKKGRLTITYSFFVWHLSLVFFFLYDHSFIFTPIIHIIVCALKYKDLSKLRVVEILKISEEVNNKDSNEEEQFKEFLGDAYKDDPNLINKIFMIDLVEKRFFGIVKEELTLPVKVTLLSGDEEEFRKHMVGHKFDVII